ncbi:MAG: aminotransferase class III-fold pyridoxal phosphate-dependent enzyme, partial [Saprospiraceae bacterium]|nr:aminotransferase class III-fold pyridoxal phosphate-dependent enzyme [Saprospiraceae bacterium]
TGGFGPYLPGIIIAPYGDIDTLKEILESEKNIASIIIEPIQGEAGVIIPPNGYLRSISNLCQKHNVLFIADEIQTGLGRTGRLLATHHENVRPDIVLLGKALSGGMLPISVVLADKKIMEVIKPGQHGSTYGGNPLAARVGITALEVIIEEKLPENAMNMGNVLGQALNELKNDAPWIVDTRGKGLLHAIEIDDDPEGNAAWDLCIQMAKQGLLAKPTRGNIIRLAPPLIINEQELTESIGIIKQVMMMHMTIA